MIAIAVESDEVEVRKVVAARKLPLRWAMGSPEIARAFGDVTAVPTLLLFDGSGRTATVYYGAPPDLHSRAETKLASLVQSIKPRS